MSDDALVRAKRREIARRYAWANKRKRPFSLLALRLNDLHKLRRGRYPNGIPNDPPGRDLLTVFAHHLAALPHDNPTHEITNFVATHAPWLSDNETKELIVDTVVDPKRWRADSLAWRLRLTDADRSILKITTIGAIDMPKKARNARRKAKSAQRSRTRRKSRKLNP